MLYCFSSQILREFLVPRKKIPQSTHYLLLYPTHSPEQLLKCCHESTSQKSWKGVFGSFGRGISFQLWGFFGVHIGLRGYIAISSLHMFESFFLTGEVHPPWLRNRGKLIPLNLGSFSGWSLYLLWTSRHLPLTSVTWRYGETGETCRLWRKTTPALLLIPQNGHLQAYCWRGH